MVRAWKTVAEQEINDATKNTVLRTSRNGSHVTRFALSHEHTEMKSHYYCRLQFVGRFHVICRVYKENNDDAIVSTSCSKLRFRADIIVIVIIQRSVALTV